jgi:hypothetical protein
MGGVERVAHMSGLGPEYGGERLDVEGCESRGLGGG